MWTSKITDFDAKADKLKGLCSDTVPGAWEAFWFGDVDHPQYGARLQSGGVGVMVAVREPQWDNDTGNVEVDVFGKDESVKFHSWTEGPKKGDMFAFAGKRLGAVVDELANISAEVDRLVGSIG